MGARINYVFNDGTDHAVVLYSHWGETEWQVDIANAIKHAKPRLRMNDIPYATRMMISYLMQDDVLSETGFGIFAINPANPELWDTTVVIDMVNQVVDNHKFDDFVSYHLEVVNA
jgi:hypothetical protein